MSHLASFLFLCFLLLIAHSSLLKSQLKSSSISASFNSSVQSDPTSHSSSSLTWLSIPSGCKSPSPLLFSSAGYNWTFALYQSLNDTFELSQPLFNCSSRYLAASTSCDDLYVTTITSSHCDELSHVWVVNEVSTRSGYYTMTNYARKGKDCLNSLLSTSNDGTLYLTDVDDGSGKQHWLLPGVPKDVSLLNDVTSSGTTASTRPSGKKTTKK